VKQVSIFLTIVALIAGMVGCVGGDGEDDGGGGSYTLIVDFTTGGTVTVNDVPIPGKAILTYNPGAVVSLNAPPDSGYQFVGWSGNVGTVANVNAASTTITVNGDYSITANFELIPPVQYSLNIIGPAYGSVTAPGEGRFMYEEGTVVELVAEPDTGYEFARWTGNVDTIADVNSTSTTITMNSEYYISAHFREAPVECYANE
jgi:uncharacterized repeat protein (TIGR02543 family)